MRIATLDDCRLDLGIDLMRSMVIYCDNQGALALSKNPSSHPRSKHIDIAYHFTRDLVLNKRLDVEYIKTDNNVADALTKALPAERIRFLLGSVGLF